MLAVQREERPYRESRQTGQIASVPAATNQAVLKVLRPRENVSREGTSMPRASQRTAFAAGKMAEGQNKVDHSLTINKIRRLIVISDLPPLEALFRT